MNDCLICGSKNVEIKKAVIADFLLERIWNNKKDKKTDLIHCKECGFAYFKQRLNEEEASHLYTGYRNGCYQQQRQKYESWYTKEINNFTSDDVAYNFSQETMEQIFCEANINIEEIKIALDYGGDTGKNIPRIFNKDTKKYVYDISGVDTEKDVIGLTDLNVVRNTKYDFIMNTGVLEHVSSPKEIVLIIKSLLRDNGITYIEVPFDSPFHKVPTDYIQFLFNKNFKIKALIDRFILNLKYPYKMHEHINYFTPESINKLLQNCGLDVKTVRVIRSKSSHFGIQDSICILAGIKIDLPAGQ
ncbi:MAG: hypothetical protein Ta2G_18130 [Termitinemataceae bacterium]|nr:MAG: hypothetical protein Ta2G_18130 [Termitinemataceae bacterium]